MENIQTAHGTALNEGLKSIIGSPNRRIPTSLCMERDAGCAKACLQVSLFQSVSEWAYWFLVTVW